MNGCRPRALVVSALLGLASATALWCRPANAAKEIGLGAAYDPRIPIGSFRSFVPDVAWSGFQAKWDYFFTDTLSIGLAVQYQLFRRGLNTNTLELPQGAVTAPSFQYAVFWSFIPTARYYFSSTEAVRPFAELGVGITAASDNFLVSDLSRHDATAALIVQPSVGVLLPLHTNDAERHEQEAIFKDSETPGHPVARGARSLESMFGVSASLACSFTTADVVGARDVVYAGVQVGIYAKP
jgi:hypothetical protein